MRCSLGTTANIVQNDCALTVRPWDNQIFVLETIPGRQFRNRIQYQDHDAGLQYFRNVIENRAASSKTSAQALDEVLGQKYLRSEYIDSLRFIPREQIIAMEDKPIGRGSNGEVFAGIWRRPHGVLATSRANAQDVDVVLKDTLLLNGQRKVSKIIAEVRSSHNGLLS